MKILDEIRTYNGKLNYKELGELVTRINYCKPQNKFY